MIGTDSSRIGRRISIQLDDHDSFNLRQGGSIAHRCYGVVSGVDKRVGQLEVNAVVPLPSY